MSRRLSFKINLYTYKTFKNNKRKIYNTSFKYHFFMSFIQLDRYHKTRLYIFYGLFQEITFAKITYQTDIESKTNHFQKLASAFFKASLRNRFPKSFPIHKEIPKTSEHYAYWKFFNQTNCFIYKAIKTE